MKNHEANNSIVYLILSAFFLSSFFPSQLYAKEIDVLIAGGARKQITNGVSCDPNCNEVISSGAGWIDDEFEFGILQIIGDTELYAITAPNPQKANTIDTLRLDDNIVEPDPPDPITGIVANIYYHGSGTYLCSSDYWKQISGLYPEKMLHVPGSLSSYDETLYLYNRLDGNVYSYDGTTFTNSTSLDPDYWVARYNDTAGEYQPFLHCSKWSSIYYFDGSTWVFSTGLDPDPNTVNPMVVWGEYDEYIAVYHKHNPEDGTIYNYDNGSWSFLTGMNPDFMINRAGNLVIHVENSGPIYEYDGASWSLISNTLDPQQWVTRGDRLVLYDGTMIHEHELGGTSWDMNVGGPYTIVDNGMVSWGTGNEYFAVCDGSTIYSFDGTTWTDIGSLLPDPPPTEGGPDISKFEEMIGWGDSNLSVDFGKDGVWNYDGSLWTQTGHADVECMTPFVIDTGESCGLTESVYYIDPDTDCTIDCDGTTDAKAFDSWEDIDCWNPGTAYLQKRNTVAELDASIFIEGIDGYNGSDYLTLGAYGETTEPLPVIMLMHDVTGTWTDAGGGVYTTTLEQHARRLFIDEAEKLKADTENDAPVGLGEDPGGGFATPEWCWINNTLYVVSSGPEEPSGVEVSGEDPSISIHNSKNIVIQNLDIQGGSSAVALISSQNCVIENANVGKYSYYGVQVQQNGLKSLVKESSGHEIHHCVFDSGYHMNYTTDDFKRWKRTLPGGSWDGVRIYGHSNKIHHNEFYDWGHTGLQFDNVGQIQPNGANNNIVHHNLVKAENISYGRGIGLNGFEGKASNNHIYSNVIQNTKSPNQIGGDNNYFYYNIIDTIPQSVFKEVLDSGTGETGYVDGTWAIMILDNTSNNYFVNNTIANCANAGISLINSANEYVENNIIQNNIIYNCGYKYYRGDYGAFLVQKSSYLKYNNYKSNYIYLNDNVSPVLYRDTYMNISDWNDLDEETFPDPDPNDDVIGDDVGVDDDNIQEDPLLVLSGDNDFTDCIMIGGPCPDFYRLIDESNCIDDGESIEGIHYNIDEDLFPTANDHPKDIVGTTINGRGSGNIDVGSLQEAQNCIYVGSGETYTTIQAAVNAASTGDTIIVKPGTYTENVTVNKEVHLQSAGGYEAVSVEASVANSYIFHVSSDNVTIDGFTMFGISGGHKAAVYIHNVDNCIVKNNRCGYDGSHKNTRGIYLINAQNNIVTNNICNSNDGVGIYLYNGDYNMITGNTCNSNPHSGYFSTHSEDNTISGNTFNNNGYGLDLVDSHYNTIYENTANNNDYYGIWFHKNTYPDPCVGNVIYLNNFSNNVNADAKSEDDTQNDWITPYKMNYSYNGSSFENYMGNYYEDHDRTDADNDGIADSPYDFPDPDSDDDYPLAVTFGNYTY